MAKNVDGGPIRTEHGDIVDEPSKGEPTPYVSKGALAARSSSPVLDSDWNNNQDEQRAEFPGNPPAPRRTGPPPDAPSPRRQRVSNRGGRQRGDQPFADKHRAEKQDLGFTAAVTGANIAHAGRHSLMRWPEYGALFPMEGVLEGPYAPLRNLEKPPGGAKLALGRENGFVDAGLAFGRSRTRRTLHLRNAGREPSNGVSIGGAIMSSLDPPRTLG